MSYSKAFAGSKTTFALLNQHEVVRLNSTPKRYIWRAKGEEILAKIQRAWKAALGENRDVTIILRGSALAIAFRNYPERRVRAAFELLGESKIDDAAKKIMHF